MPMLNGALTIGTLDGANVEIREEVGDDNFFLFGLHAHEVKAVKSAGYSPRDFYDGNAELRGAIDAIADGTFSDGDRSMFRPMVDGLLGRDEYLLLADYASYIRSQDEVALVYQDQELWSQKSILTTARMGKFSSDRTITEYCRDIWRVEPVIVERG